MENSHPNTYIDTVCLSVWLHVLSACYARAVFALSVWCVFTRALVPIKPGAVVSLVTHHFSCYAMKLDRQVCGIMGVL